MTDTSQMTNIGTYKIGIELQTKYTLLNNKWTSFGLLQKMYILVMYTFDQIRTLYIVVGIIFFKFFSIS